MRTDNPQCDHQRGATVVEHWTWVSAFDQDQWQAGDRDVEGDGKQEISFWNPLNLLEFAGDTANTLWPEAAI
jgi:hypothetical protein